MAYVWNRFTGVELSNPLTPTAQEIVAFQINSDDSHYKVIQL